MEFIEIHGRPAGLLSKNAIPRNPDRRKILARHNQARG